MSYSGAVAAVGNPARWPLIPLRRLLSQSDKGGRPDLPLLGVNLQTGVSKRREDDGRPAPSEDLTSYKVVYPGDVIMNRLGKPHGSVGISPWMGITSPAYWVMRVDRRIAEPRFVHHLLRSRHMIAEYNRLGKFMPPNQFDISWDSFRSIDIPLPPLNDQRRIADFLDAETARMDRILGIRLRQIDVLNERLVAFERLAVAGVSERAGTDSGIPWIGTVCDKAKVVRLARVVTLQRGVDLTDAQRRPGDVPVVTTTGIAGKHDRAIVSGPGVVIGRYGSAGSVHWVDTAFWPHNTTLYVKNFHGNRPRYCYYLLRTLPYEMEQARSAVPGLNRNDLHQRLVPLLPVELQDRAVELMDDQHARTRRVVDTIQTGLALLAERRRSLITAAVTGQFDVTTTLQSGSSRSVD